MNDAQSPLPDPAPVIVELQRLLLAGTAWRRHGDTPATGLGCYGLLVFAFALAGIALPQRPQEGASLFAEVTPPWHAWDVLCCQLDEPHLLLVLMPPDAGFHVSRLSNGVARFSLQQGVWRRTLRAGWRLKEFCP